MAKRLETYLQMDLINQNMKIITLLFIVTFFGSISSLKANSDTTNVTQAKEYYYQAKIQLQDMLEGKIPLSYEKAIFILENAYYENQLNEELFSLHLDVQTEIIKNIRKQGEFKRPDEFKSTRYRTKQEQIRNYENVLSNWAIFKYMTDSNTYILLESFDTIISYPFEYPDEDPLATKNWENSQVTGLFKNNKGNCFALASLYKIFADRLNSDARLVNAPGHIFIQHEDENKTTYNVELATKSFPGNGTIETLTHTSDESIRNGISMLALTKKQEVALCLVYLAKGYEYKFKENNSDFSLACADLALTYDPKNLNAMLLKAQTLESIVLEDQPINNQSKHYLALEKQIQQLYALGYREMPSEMKQMFFSSEVKPKKDYTPKAFTSIDDDMPYITLSNGAFEEMHRKKPEEVYFNTVFDTKTRKIKKVDQRLTANNVEADLVVFALSVDPLHGAFAYNSPYAFSENRVVDCIELEGLERFEMNSHDPGLQSVKATKKEVKSYQKTVNKSNPIHIIGTAIFEGQYAEGEALLDAYQDGGVQSMAGVGAKQATSEFRSGGMIGAKTGGVKANGKIKKSNSAVIKKKVESNASNTIKGQIQTNKLQVAQTPTKEIESNVIQVGNQNTAKIMLTTSNNKMPKKVTTIIDKNTGKTYVGTNGKRDINTIEKSIRDKLPDASKEKWPCTQCAEVDALNKAASDGAKIGDNLDVYTNEINKKARTYGPVETCANCKETTKGTNVISDGK